MSLRYGKTFAGVSVFSREFWNALEDIADLAKKYEALTPGPGIIIEGNTISTVDHTGELSGGGGASGGLFPVIVQWTGFGDAGSDTTRCSFTYDVRDITGGGGDLALGVQPLKNRSLFGKYVAPTHGDFNLYGTGFYIGETFYLYDANEVYFTEECA